VIRTEIESDTRPGAVIAAERWVEAWGYGYGPSYNIVERAGKWVALCRRYASCG